MERGPFVPFVAAPCPPQAIPRLLLTRPLLHWLCGVALELPTLCAPLSTVTALTGFWKPMAVKLWERGGGRKGQEGALTRSQLGVSRVLPT